MHRSLFHAVENAPEIRDLILARLQRYRQAGLGEPDDANDQPSETVEESRTDKGTLAAAKELLNETRALRTEFK
jgi:hypothetical protein